MNWGVLKSWWIGALVSAGLLAYGVFSLVQAVSGFNITDLESWTAILRGLVFIVVGIYNGLIAYDAWNGRN